MYVVSTRLPGLLEVHVEPLFDERGSFARTYDRATLEDLGLDGEVAEITMSQDRLLGTLRGLHWQAAPGRRTQLVRVLEGRIFEVAVDLRSASSTFGAWASFELSAEDGTGLFVPAGFAHGFMTLADDTRVLYQTNEADRPELARTLRWDDPELAIEWPIAPRAISREDATCATRLGDLRARSAA